MAQTRRSRVNSDASPLNMNARSVLFFRKPSLGDKLQRLARLSPKYVDAVELLVDQMLRRLEHDQRRGLKRVLVCLLALGVT